MRRRQSMSPTRTSPATLLLLLLAAFAIPPSAHSQAVSKGNEFSTAYDRAHETTLTGVIQAISIGREAGSPAGMRLSIIGSQGAIETHLGPYLNKETQAALQAGTAVQVTGAMGNSQGKQVLLARQIVFSGRVLDVRNDKGFLIRPQASHERPAQSRKPGAEENGGSR